MRKSFRPLEHSYHMFFLGRGRLSSFSPLSLARLGVRERAFPRESNPVTSHAFPSWRGLTLVRKRHHSRFFLSPCRFQATWLSPPPFLRQSGSNLSNIVYYLNRRYDISRPHDGDLYDRFWFFIRTLVQYRIFSDGFGVACRPLGTQISPPFPHQSS